MNPKNKKHTFLALLLSAILLITGACQASSQAAATQPGSGNTPAGPAADTPVNPGEASAVPTETSVPVVHVLTPASPPISFESQIQDTDTSPVAIQHGTNGGESYLIDRFERPFDQSMNTYFPDLDITHAALNRDATWFYVTLTLAGQDPTGDGLLQDYGIELDLNQDGRGDYLIIATAPAADWTTDGVRVWQDADHDVGSTNPLDSDAPTNGNGYETQIFDQGHAPYPDPDAAWARISPSDPDVVQLAFKRALISDSSRFLWGAWAIAPETLHPDWFDYDDHFTQADAGSSLLTLTQYYPLKAFYEADNTCRWAVGFTPTGSEPGICPVPATPTPSPTLTLTPTATVLLPGNINGTVFYDSNANGKWNPLHDNPINGATVRVRAGDCGSAGIVVLHQTATQSSGHFSINVPPGIYCVDVNPDPTSIAWNQKSPPFSVNVHSGGSVLVNFWYREAIH